MALTNREKQARWRERLKAKATAFDQLQAAPAQAPAITPESVLEALEALPPDEGSDLLTSLLRVLDDHYTAVDVQNNRIRFASTTMRNDFADLLGSIQKLGAMYNDERYFKLAPYPKTWAGFMDYLRDHHDNTLSLTTLQRRIKVYNASHRFGPDFWFRMEGVGLIDILVDAASFITPKTTKTEARAILDFYVENVPGFETDRSIADATAVLRKRSRPPE
jgi:hypothetical protein